MLLKGIGGLAVKEHERGNFIASDSGFPVKHSSTRDLEGKVSIFEECNGWKFRSKIRVDVPEWFGTCPWVERCG